MINPCMGPSVASPAIGRSGEVSSCSLTHVKRSLDDSCTVRDGCARKRLCAQFVVAALLVAEVLFLGGGSVKNQRQGYMYLSS